eukprot:3781044-Amphidinium_carterae.2
MGWRNAVGLLVQSIHKKETTVPRPWSAGLPINRQVGADKPLPVLSLRGGNYRKVWQFYIDDFDTMELVAATDEGSAEFNSRQAAAREVYVVTVRSFGTTDLKRKTRIRERRCTRLGLSLDGLA